MNFMIGIFGHQVQGSKETFKQIPSPCLIQRKILWLVKHTFKGIGTPLKVCYEGVCMTPSKGIFLCKRIFLCLQPKEGYLWQDRIIAWPNGFPYLWPLISLSSAGITVPGVDFIRVCMSQTNIRLQTNIRFKRIFVYTRPMYLFAQLTPKHTFSVYEQTKSSLKVSFDPWPWAPKL
jgi:hypothetical protein